MNYDKDKTNLNTNIANHVVERHTSLELAYSRYRHYQQPIRSSSHQELIDESRYLIVEAKKMMGNSKVTCSSQELIDESKSLIAHAEKLLSNCKAMHSLRV